jgi:nucleotide-binding universal stress UspA family protein
MQIWCSTDDSLAGDAALRVSAELADRLRAGLAELHANASDPAPLLLLAGHAAGCDRVVVGVTRSTGSLSMPDGWQRRVVLSAPSLMVLVPVGAALPRGGVVLASDVAELPSQVARVAGRLAGRLDAPLIITHVLPVPASRPSDRQRRDAAAVEAGRKQLATGSPPVVRRAGSEREPGRPPVGIAARQDAALVVIGGRGPGRTLRPRSRAAPRLPSNARLPIVVTTAPALC